MRIHCIESDHRFPPEALHLLGHRTGLIKDLLWYLPDRSDPELFYVTVDEAELEPLTGVSDMALDAGGTGLDPESALMSAIGEAAERYSLLLPDHGDLLEGTYREIARIARVPDYSLLEVHTSAQAETAGFEVLTPDRTIQWQPATNLLSGQTVYVPAQLVWLTLIKETQRYYPTTSNGTACASTRPNAVCRALAEYIERDAIMRSWYRHETTRRVDITRDDDLTQLVSDRFESEYLSMELFSVESPTGLPVIGSAALDTRDRIPKFALGGACSLSARDACQAALIEAAQTWIFLKDRLAAVGMPTDIDPHEILNLTDNLLYYAAPERYADAEFLLGERTQPLPAADTSPETDRRKLAEYLKRCRKANVTPLAVDVTAPDIRDVGFTVVRVILPELLDLALPSLPPLKHPALADAEVTAKPHPYP